MGDVTRDPRSRDWPTSFRSEDRAIKTLYLESDADATLSRGIWLS